MHGLRAEREPITEVWGSAPSGVQQSPWSGGQGEAHCVSFNARACWADITVGLYFTDDFNPLLIAHKPAPQLPPNPSPSQ